MTTWIVTRHSGTKLWLEQQGIQADYRVDDLDIALPQAGDTIIGILPIQHVAALNQKGVRYLHLTLNVPERLRGQELEAEQVSEFCGQLQEYQVSLVPD